MINTVAKSSLIHGFISYEISNNVIFLYFVFKRDRIKRLFQDQQIT